MHNFWKVANILVLCLLLLICGLGIFYKHISFGYGLGDILAYIILITGTLIHLIITIRFFNRELKYHILTTLFFSFFASMTLIFATIGRGSQYKWNGQLFYMPCATEIKIENTTYKESVTIKMCSMEYYSKLTGTWDGEYMNITDGEVKIPRELNKQLDFPIKKIEIEFSSNDEKKAIADGSYYFNKNVLIINKPYTFQGEISAIKNRVPVFTAKMSKPYKIY